MQIEKYLNKIHCEDALSFCKKLPDNVIDCIVTSPPYWGLRDYGLEPIIFGGDKNCEHIWNGYTRPKNTWGEPNKNIAGIFKNAESNTSIVKEKELHFCQKCNAWKGQLGLEPTFHLFIDHLIDIFSECKRILKPDGTMWVNFGDSYSSNHKESNSNGIGNNSLSYVKNQRRCGRTFLQSKCLCQIPSRFAIAMTDKLGMILRNEIIWYKPNCMPSSVSDRFTVDFEKIYFFTKSKKYYFKQQFEKLKENSLNRAKYATHSEKAKTNIYAGMNLEKQRKAFDRILSNDCKGRNMRAVWKISTQSFKEAHFATFPPELVRRCLDAGCKNNGVVYDPFLGAGTVALVALQNNLNFIGTELSPEYCDIANARIEAERSQLKLPI